MVLPFSVQVTSLLKQFCDRFPAVSLSEIILAFLNLPREDFMADNSVDMSTETEEKDHNLSEKGEVLVTLLECFLSKGNIYLVVTYLGY